MEGGAVEFTGKILFVLQHVTLELRREDWPAAKLFWETVGFHEVDPPEVDERPRHWGAARCFVRAPGGHRVELMAAPPA